jgi:hypothetical protein
MQHGKTTLAATMASLLLGAAPASWAALNAVDTPPYLAANGFFPAWYQDTNGLGLDLCLSTAASPNPAAAGGLMCVLVPNPGIYDPAYATCFPGQCAGVTLPPGQIYNFPDESFYATADAIINANGVVLNYVSAVEAAFGTGLPTANDQITFARIRVRVTLPAGSPVGTYTITHPFGVETANVANAGVKVINLTRDIGVAPGIFSGALAGDIGPFLRRAASAGGAASPFIESVNPETGQTEQFIGDPNVLPFATGSPFGTNFVRIERITNLGAIRRGTTASPPISFFSRAGSGTVNGPPASAWTVRPTAVARRRAPGSTYSPARRQMRACVSASFWRWSETPTRA